MFIDQETRLRVNIHAPYKGRSKLDTPEIRAAVGVIEIPDPVAPEDYSPDTHYMTEQDDAPYVVYMMKSPAQIAELMVQKAKQQRREQVDAITVTTASGKEFDGNEDAQNRMARAVLGLPDGEVIQWVLADNTVSTAVTKEELLEALRLAGVAQTALWAVPYTS